MNRRVEAFLFDLGNVLLPFDYGRTTARIRPYCRVDPTSCSAEIARLSAQHETGAIGEDAFFDALGALLGYTGSQELLLEAWCDIFTVNEAMVEFASGLGSRFKRFALSNIGATHARHIERAYGFLGMLDGRVYSFAAGVMKPDPAIYRHAIESLALNPDATVFIDDKLENVEAGNAAGFFSLHYNAGSHGEFLAAVEPLLKRAASDGSRVYT